MEILWMLIVGGIIGWLAGLITGRDVPGGLGGLILGSWGPVIGGFAIIPAIIGSIILVLIVSFLLRKMGQKKNHGHHV
ncbi:GlsB/YeaQ/YmgE family stress response membrane protein [Priestia megaterium]|uniref:GlsB/YeaQ/YmgE family stress response membrane protein n=1 Tax=Priestia megaterium TaxID=1404 RepID=UPI0033991E22